MYRKQTEVNKAANAENHTSCIQNEWQQGKKGRGEEGKGGGKGGIHSFLSYDAEMDEGVHTGQVSALAGLAIISRDVVFLRLRRAPFLRRYLLTDVSCARGQNGGKTTFLV